MWRELTFLGIKPRRHQYHVISEFGLGGGGKKSDQLPKTIEEMLAHPWNGPGTNSIWENLEYKKTRYRYFQSFLMFLARPLAEELKIKSAYIWSAPTWDPQGIYDPKLTFDQDIFDMIETHNHSIQTL